MLSAEEDGATVLPDTADRAAALGRALDAIQARAEEMGDEPFETEVEDALSALDAVGTARYREVFQRLPPPDRARLVRALHDAAEKRLRLDYSALNHVALEDPDEDVRLAAVEASLEDRSLHLLEYLLRVVRADASTRMRRAAAEELARFALLAELDALDAASSAGVRTTLLAVLHDEAEHADVRSSALAALGYFDDAAMKAELEDAFVDPALRLGAVRGMGRSADPRFTDRLMPVLGSEDPEMRIEAARALGEIEDERALTPLVELVDDPERDVRLAAIAALGEIGGEEAREALLYLLNDEDTVIRDAADRVAKDLEAEEDDPLDT